jgi:ABC-type nitrate/sulfonate/bicarbonate transport system substrate-binding protein/pterin-4a-carbinolamine dehydratase
MKLSCYLIAWLLLGAACRVAAETAADATPVHLVVQLDLGVKNAQFAGLLVAEQRGWYREAGLDVTLVKATDTTDVAAVVAASDHTLGSIESGLFLTGRSRGLPLVAIGTMFQASPLCQISLTAKGIRTPADWIGKKIAVGADGHEAIDAVLAKAGLTHAQLTLLDADYDNAPLLDGRYDSKQGYLIDEYVALRLAGHDVSAILLSDYGNVAYSQVMFVSRAFLAKNRAALVKFLAVSNRGWRAAVADPAAAAKMIVDRYEPSLGLAYQTESLRQIAPFLTKESLLMGTMKRATWEENARAFLHSRPGVQLPPLEEWVDFTLADEADTVGGSAAGGSTAPHDDRLNPVRVLLSPAEIAAALTRLPGWKADAGRISKSYVFKDFAGAIAFINAFAPECERLDHHAEIFTVYNKVNLTLTTFAEGQSISSYDILLAERIEALIPKLASPPKP